MTGPETATRSLALVAFVGSIGLGLLPLASARAASFTVTRTMNIVVPKSGAARFTAAGKRMELSRYAQTELMATVRVGDRCSRAPVMLRARKNKKFVFP
jgi:hypothetical protein